MEQLASLQEEIPDPRMLQVYLKICEVRDSMQAEFDELRSILKAPQSMLRKDSASINENCEEKRNKDYVEDNSISQKGGFGSLSTESEQTSPSVACKIAASNSYSVMPNHEFSTHSSHHGYDNAWLPSKVAKEEEIANSKLMSIDAKSNLDGVIQSCSINKDDICENKVQIRKKAYGVPIMNDIVSSSIKQSRHSSKVNLMSSVQVLFNNTRKKEIIALLHENKMSSSSVLLFNFSHCNENGSYHAIDNENAAQLLAEGVHDMKLGKNFRHKIGKFNPSSQYQSEKWVFDPGGDIPLLHGQYLISLSHSGCRQHEYQAQNILHKEKFHMSHCFDREAKLTIEPTMWQMGQFVKVGNAGNGVTCADNGAVTHGISGLARGDQVQPFGEQSNLYSISTIEMSFDYMLFPLNFECWSCYGDHGIIPSILEFVTISYLEEWSLIEKDHSSSLSEVMEELKASTLKSSSCLWCKGKYPRYEESCCAAGESMQAMTSSMCSLFSKLDAKKLTICEMAKVAAQEHTLLK